MAICPTGNLSICATAGACRSISTAVGTGSGSLSALSVSAGKSAPHCMREFYGFSLLYVVPTSINFEAIPSNCNVCICASVGLSWSIVKSDSWILTIDAGSGSGSDTVTFSAENYEGIRGGYICITSIQPTATITVNQGVF